MQVAPSPVQGDQAQPGSQMPQAQDKGCRSGTCRGVPMPRLLTTPALGVGHSFTDDEDAGQPPLPGPQGRARHSALVLPVPATPLDPTPRDPEGAHSSECQGPCGHRGVHVSPGRARWAPASQDRTPGNGCDVCWHDVGVACSGGALHVLQGAGHPQGGWPAMEVSGAEGDARSGADMRQVWEATREGLSGPREGLASLRKGCPPAGQGGLA